MNRKAVGASFLHWVDFTKDRAATEQLSTLFNNLPWVEVLLAVSKTGNQVTMSGTVKSWGWSSFLGTEAAVEAAEAAEALVLVLPERPLTVAAEQLWSSILKIKKGKPK